MLFYAEMLFEWFKIKIPQALCLRDFLLVAKAEFEPTTFGFNAFIIAICETFI